MDSTDAVVPMNDLGTMEIINRELNASLIETRQKLADALTENSTLQTKYSHLYDKYCNLENMVKTHIVHFSNFLKQANPQMYYTNNGNRTSPQQSYREVKTQQVSPHTVNGHVLLRPKISLVRLNTLPDIDIVASRSAHVSTQALNPGPSSTADTEQIRIVLERLPLVSLQETDNRRSRTTGSDIRERTNSFDALLRNGDQRFSDPLMDCSTCNNSSSLSTVSQLRVKIFRSALSSPNLRRKRARRVSRSAVVKPGSPKPKTRKVSKWSRTNLINDKFVVVLLDRKEMTRLMSIRNPVVRINRMLLDNSSLKRTNTKCIENKENESEETKNVSDNINQTGVQGN